MRKKKVGKKIKGEKSSSNKFKERKEERGDAEGKKKEGSFSASPFKKKKTFQGGRKGNKTAHCSERNKTKSPNPFKRGGREGLHSC